MRYFGGRINKLKKLVEFYLSIRNTISKNKSYHYIYEEKKQRISYDADHNVFLRADIIHIYLYLRYFEYTHGRSDDGVQWPEKYFVGFAFEILTRLIGYYFNWLN